ncbi:IS66 family transposase [Kiloniella antarctica]|uniref:Transposase n=1 Tax=Kiloniella antarctica TaxID=1550907 RepID=A0ABW5BR76_9PROT
MSSKTPLAGAIRYAITRMKPYLDHGFLELDNNTVERSMRAIALAEKTTCSWGLTEVASQPLLPIPSLKRLNLQN